MQLKKQTTKIQISIKILQFFAFILFMFSFGFYYKKFDLYWIPILNTYSVQNSSELRYRSNNLESIDLTANTNYSRSFSNVLAEPAEIENFNIDFDIQPRPQAIGTVRVPVFVYHHIGINPQSYDDKIGNVTPEMFREQMSYLAQKEYKVLDMKAFYDLLEKGTNPIQKSVLLTFDDGYQDFYDNAFPILKEFGFKATLFIPVDKKELSDSELLEMSNYGIDIQGHTMSHASLSRSRSTQTLNYELNTAKQRITEITDKETFAFAYPYCGYNATNLNYLKSTEYKLSFQCGDTKGTSIDHTFANRYELYRSWAYNNMSNFIARLSGIEQRPNDLGESGPTNFKFKML